MEIALLMLVALGEIALGWLVLSGHEYAKAKGKNLADKEDIAQITRLVKAVEHEHNVLLEQVKGTGQLRLAAAERRLQAHQDAFTLWRKLIQHTHEEDAGTVVLECQQWWERNCVFLAPGAMEAFSSAFHAAGDHRTLLESGRFGTDKTEAVKLIRANWATIMGAGNAILEGAALPPLGQAAAGAPDAFGSRPPAAIAPA